MNRHEIGFKATDILLPLCREMEKWSVVACDQYTSEPEYWARIRKNIDDAPSALHLILPEAELETADPNAVQEKMDDYLSSSLFRTLKDSMIYLRRTLSNGKVRQGLIGALDLECYQYQKGATTLCRATEGTVEDRLPPRIRVREKARIEMPHIMVLIDDPAFTVIEALESKCNTLDQVYDFSLMENGGSVCGYALHSEQYTPVLDALADLAGKDQHPLLFAVGDGNHSLATAKACYEKIKFQEGEKALDHPARYCLVELVNLHSPALEFEPIHRVIFDADQEQLMAALTEAGLEEGGANDQKIEIVLQGERKLCSFAKTTSELAVGSLQNALDQFIKNNNGKIDYIHGADVVERLCREQGAIGFILPNMEKESLFPTVVADGALPRKTFSMGHAHDKRFYLECRRIERK